MRAHFQKKDAVQFLGTLNDSSVDLICTDPAYAELEAHRQRGGTTVRLAKSDASSNDWFPTVPDTYFPGFFAECLRVLKPGNHIYVFANRSWKWKAQPMLVKAGFRFYTEIIWNKVKMGMGYKYRAQYESILFAIKPAKKERRLNDLGQPDFVTFTEDGVPDVIHVPRLKGKPPTVFPTQKPRELLELLVRQSSNRGELVCDPFAGAPATAGVAALRLGRGFLGSEIHDPYYQHACKVLEHTKEVGNAA